MPRAESRRFLERQAKNWAKTGETPPEHDGWRPKVRADCSSFPRPCPFVGCKYHLFLDVGREGQIKYNFGDDVDALAKMKDTCALDVANQGGMHLESVGALMNFTRERARQQEEEGLAKLRVAQACASPEDTSIPEHAYS